MISFLNFLLFTLCSAPLHALSIPFDGVAVDTIYRDITESYMQEQSIHSKDSNNVPLSAEQWNDFLQSDNLRPFIKEALLRWSEQDSSTFNPSMQQKSANSIPFLGVPALDFDRIPRIEFDELRNVVQTGDIILFSGEDPIGRFLRRFTVSPYSHVGTYMCNISVYIHVWLYIIYIYIK
jgi:hypothetical protein